MPANNETRVIKTNTFEDWRQKGNEVSFELGDVDQLDSRILDKNQSWTASADDHIFSNLHCAQILFQAVLCHHKNNPIISSVV